MVDTSNEQTNNNNIVASPNGEENCGVLDVTKHILEETWKKTKELGSDVGRRWEQLADDTREAAKDFSSKQAVDPANNGETRDEPKESDILDKVKDTANRGYGWVVNMVSGENEKQQVEKSTDVDPLKSVVDSVTETATRGYEWVADRVAADSKKECTSGAYEKDGKPAIESKSVSDSLQESVSHGLGLLPGVASVGDSKGDEPATDSRFVIDDPPTEGQTVFESVRENISKSMGKPTWL